MTEESKCVDTERLFYAMTRENMMPLKQDAS